MANGTPQQWLEVERLYYLDTPIRTISEITGFGRGSIYNYIAKNGLEERKAEIQKTAKLKTIKKIDKIAAEKIDITKAVANCLQIEVNLLNTLVSNIDKMQLNYSSDSMIRNISLLTNDILLQTGYQDLASVVEKEYHIIFQTILQRLEIALSKDNYNIVVSIFREELEKVKLEKENKNAINKNR